MDDRMSDLNERPSASCRETLQQLDDIEAKLAGLHAAIERGCGRADETRRPQAARAELAAVADLRRALSPRDVDENLTRRPGQGGSVSIFASAGRPRRRSHRAAGRCPRVQTDNARREPLRS
jgi:hypothetical protein